MLKQQDRSLFAEYEAFLMTEWRLARAGGRGSNHEKVRRGEVTRFTPPVSQATYDLGNSQGLSYHMEPKTVLTRTRFGFEVYNRTEGFAVQAPADGRIKLEIFLPEKLSLPLDRSGHDTGIIVMDFGNGLEGIMTHALATSGSKELKEGKPFGIQQGHLDGVIPHIHIVFGKRDEDGVLQPYEVGFKPYR